MVSAHNKENQKEKKTYVKMTPFIPMQVLEQLLKRASLYPHIIMYREITTFLFFSLVSFKIRFR